MAEFKVKKYKFTNTSPNLNSTISTNFFAPTLVAQLTFKAKTGDFVNLSGLFKVNNNNNVFAGVFPQIHKNTIGNVISSAAIDVDVENEGDRLLVNLQTTDEITSSGQVTYFLTVSADISNVILESPISYIAIDYRKS